MYTIKKEYDLPIVTVTLMDPLDFRKDPPVIMSEVANALGDITGPFWTIYDLRKISMKFANIIDGLAGVAHPLGKTGDAFMKHGRMSLVGAGLFIELSAKTAQRFSPSKNFLVFDTPEEALAHARADLTKRPD